MRAQLRWPALPAVLSVAIPLLALTSSAADESGHGHGSMKSPQADPSISIGMDELHRHGGVPPGWRFTLPAGDPRAGREVCAELTSSWYISCSR
jgi:hypothetical protein